MKEGHPSTRRLITLGGLTGLTAGVVAAEVFKRKVEPMREMKKKTTAIKERVIFQQ